MPRANDRLSSGWVGVKSTAGATGIVLMGVVTGAIVIPCIITGLAALYGFAKTLYDGDQNESSRNQFFNNATNAAMLLLMISGAYMAGVATGASLGVTDVISKFVGPHILDPGSGPLATTIGPAVKSFFLAHTSIAASLATGVGVFLACAIIGYMLYSHFSQKIDNLQTSNPQSRQRSDVEMTSPRNRSNGTSNQNSNTDQTGSRTFGSV